MAKQKRYLEIDVLEAARARIRHLYDVFDTVAVAFSGGKDSLVCLHLVREEAERRGRLPVDVIFRDEELIPDSVIDFVDGYRRRDWVRMRWFAYPLQSDEFVLGEHRDYVQWDPGRAHVRPMPDWAIRPPVPGKVYSQTEMDHITCAGYKGKVALVLGIRASESLVRFRSVVNKLNENWITRPGGYKGHRIKSCKPIYDWAERDIFKYLSAAGVEWCSIYEHQSLAGHPLRVATPLHAEGAKRMKLLQRMDPDFYGRLIAVFPEADLQARYWGEYDQGALMREFGDSWDGCRRYIETHIIEPVSKNKALARLRENEKMARRQPERYTPELLLKALVSGTIKRVLLPQTKSKARA